LYAFGACYAIITALISKDILYFQVNQLTPQLTPLLELQSGVNWSLKSGVSCYLTVVSMPLVLVMP
jgi:hypothetical protein